jgi:putative membrane protein
MRLIINWLLTALALLLVSRLVHGFEVRGFMSALWAALVIGLVNATLGALLKFLTLPLSILTFGLFLIVINALMLEFASWFAPGFRVASFGVAFLGSIILSLLNMLFRWLLFGDRR